MNLQEIWSWLQSHPATMSMISVGIYHVAAAFVGSLEMPNDQSGSLYRFFFNFVNKLAANYSRASASTTSAGYQEPKAPTIPGPEVPAPPKQP